MKFTLQIFARYPRLGHVKTRLAATLGDNAAIELHCELVERQLEQVAQLPRRIGCEFWCTETANAPWCSAIFQRYPRLRYRRQAAGTLGQRMEGALRRGMQYSSGVLQIGTDCPVLNAEHMALCVHAIQGGTDSVLIAAEDGGYVLAGYGKYRRNLYKDIDWGTEHVLEQTVERHIKEGLSPLVYSSLWDVDRHEDYERYQQLAIPAGCASTELWQTNHG